MSTSVLEGILGHQGMGKNLNIFLVMLLLFSDLCHLNFSHIKLDQVMHL